MADKKTVPIFDPSGKVRQIPEDQVDAALQSGGKRAVRMSDPQGTARWVRDSDVDAATKAGGKVAEEGLKGTWEKLLGKGAGPASLLLNPEAIKNSASHAVSAVTGPVHAIADQPQGTAENVIDAVGGRGPLAAYRVGVKPSLEAAREAFKQARAGNISPKNDYDAAGNYHPSAVSSAIDTIPVVGPWSRNVENEAHTKGAVPALAGMLTDIAAPEVIPKAVTAVPGVVGKTVSKIVAPSSTVDKVIPGDTVTPRQRWQQARQQGVNLDTAQATNARVPTIAKKVSEHSLTGSGKFADNTAANVAALEDHAKAITDKITPDKLSREDFGTGVQTALKLHQEHLNAQAGQIFDDLDSRVGSVHPDLVAVRTQAQKIVADNADYYKAHPELLTGASKQAWNVVNSLAEEAKAPKPKLVPFDDGFGPRPPEPTPPAPPPDSWSNLHKLRSDLMNMYRSPDIVGSNAEGWLKQLTGKVDESMTGAASGLSPADEAEFRQANKIYTDMKQTYDNPQHKLFHIIRAPDGLTVSNSLANVTPHVSRQIWQAGQDLGMPEIHQQLQRQTVERLLDPSGNGTPDLKNLPQRFSKTQKESLNGVLTPDQVEDIDQLARTSKVVHADSNPSGTAKTIQPASEAGSMIAGAGTAATGLATANPALVAAGVAPFVEAGATRLAASKLTNPAFTEKVMNPPASTAVDVDPKLAAAATAANVTQHPQQDQPTIQDKEVVPADASRGIQPVTLPVTVPPDNLSEPAASPDTHHFSKKAWVDQHPTGDVDEASKLAEQAGYEVQP